MANRYWVGGTGTWDATTTTNWAATSNGTAGASAPTSVDSVFFDSSSNATAYTVTIGTNAAALDVSIVGPASGSVTITSSATSVINVYGSWTNAATGVVFSTTTGAIINFLATTTGKTVTTNNITLGGMTVIFNGVGGGWTLGSAFTHTQVFTVTAGTFSTGNFALISGGFSSSGTGIRSVTFGTSTVTLSGSAAWTFTTTTNLTFSGASSTINCSGASATFAGGSLTYNVVNFTSVSGATHTITGTNTFATLSFTTRTSDGLGNIVLAANQTISGTLTLGTANTAVRRIFVQSDTIGTQRTLTVATLAALSDVDFADTIAAGASGTWSGTRLGNCKNNSNITFPAAKTVYFSSSAGASANWGSASWATTSGGADFSTSNFPLAQDTAVIDDAGTTTGNGLRTSGTITLGASWNIGSFLSTRTAAYTFVQGNSDPTIYGDFTLSSGISITVLTSPTWTFSGQGVIQNITTAGKAINATNTSVVSPGGTVKLLDPWTQAIPSGATAATFTLNAGTLDLNGFTLTANAFSNSNNNVRTLAFGTTGKIVLFGSGGTTYSGSVSTNLTVSGTAPLVQFTYSGATGTRNIVMSNSLPESQAISVEFLNNATDTVFIQGSSGSYKNITFTSFSGTLGFANTPIIYGNLFLCAAITPSTGTTLTFSGTSNNQLITSNGYGFTAAITVSGTNNTLKLQDTLTVVSTRAVTLTSGNIDLNTYTLTAGQLVIGGAGNVKSLIFGTSKIVLTGTNATIFSNTDGPSLTVTGTPRIELTGAGTAGQTRTVTGPLLSLGAGLGQAFDFYITTGSDTVNIGTAARIYKTLNFTGFSGSLNTQAAPYIYGDLVIPATMTVGSSTNTWTFAGTGTVDTNNVLIDVPVDFSNSSGVWTFNSAFSIGTNSFTFTSGTVKFKSGTTNTVGSFITSGTIQKYLQSSISGSQATLSDASGNVSVDYITIQDNSATGGAFFYAGPNSVINTNVTGWTTTLGEFLTFF